MHPRSQTVLSRPCLSAIANCGVKTVSVPNPRPPTALPLRCSRLRRLRVSLIQSRVPTCRCLGNSCAIVRAWRGLAWRGVAWRGVACGVACGVAWRHGPSCRGPVQGVPTTAACRSFRPLCATTVSHGVATGSLPAQFHVTFGAPVLRGFGNRKREFQGAGAGRGVSRASRPSVQHAAHGHDRHRCAHRPIRVRPLQCACPRARDVCVCARARAGGLSAVTCLPWQQRHERALRVQRGDG
jgi:hypothetical protein